MKYTTEWYLNCESSDRLKEIVECHGQSDGAFSRMECIQQAEEEGWLVDKRKAYCPECKSAYLPVKEPAK
jgi:hypothetical protein